MVPANDPVRQECYTRIINVMKDGLAAHYRYHPEHFNDARSKMAANESYEGVRKILLILEDYDISRKSG